MHYFIFIEEFHWTATVSNMLFVLYETNVKIFNTINFWNKF